MGAFRIFRRLQDLLDVNPAGLADNDVPTWDAATSKFTMEAGGGGGGAPTNVDYLVGTADATLSNEIVVGATPGGELGNTWASPTVDTIHSGSSHAATQAAAEAASVILAPASSARNVIQPMNGDTIAAIIKSHADWQTGLASGDMLDFQDENGVLIAGFFRSQLNDIRSFFMYDDANQDVAAFFSSRGYEQFVRTGATTPPILLNNQDGSAILFKMLPTGFALICVIAAPADADIGNSQGGWWWDQANSLPKWKGKTSGGVVVNFTPVSETTFNDHSARHESGGADAIKLDDLAAPDDNTDLNVSTTKHGLTPKLSNVATEFLSGTGVFSTPSGSGIPSTIVDAKGDLLVATAADTVARKAVGANGAGLVADDAQSDGVQWRTAIARHRDRNVGMGLLAESFPAMAAAQNGTHNTGSVVGAAVYLYKGEVITNILVCVNNAASGAAPTLFKLGLWSSAATPVCLAVTADLKSDAMWNSVGFKVAPLSAPYTVLADGIFYPVFLIVGAFGGTAIQFNRGNNAFTGNPIGAFPRGSPVIKTGATDMVVSDTGSGSSLGPQWWIGVS